VVRKTLILDTYYPEFLARLQFRANDYAGMLAEALATGFGTADFVSNGFRAAGWEAVDLIANCEALSRRWQTANCPAVGVTDWFTLQEAALEFVRQYHPDVLFLQDVSFFTAAQQRIVKHHGVKIAAQISCAMPREENVRECDVIFTSFPHYVERFNGMGSRGVFSKLCFEPALLDRIGKKTRDLDCVFVGGVCGNDATGCWTPGTALLEVVAAAVPSFLWWGYGYDTLKPHSILRERYQGQAWGLDQYRIYARAKIALNRHSIHANNCGNNMRCHEAVGMGAMLLTDSSDSYKDGEECIVYRDAEDAVRSVRAYLDNPVHRIAIADAGQRRCLAENTYAIRYKEIATHLEKTP
jgi:spore maturation protein CgeB